MHLNNLYSELLDNYLKYFLPIEKNDVTFPSVSSSNKIDSNEIPTAPRQQITTSKHPRLLKQQPVTQFLQPSSSEHTKKGKTYICERNRVRCYQAIFVIDRTNELAKINFFLHLLVEIWLSPYSNEYTGYAAMQPMSNFLLPNVDTIFAIRQIIEHVYRFSNMNYHTKLIKPFDFNNNSALKHSNIFQSSTSIPIDDLRLYVH